MGWQSGTAPQARRRATTRNGAPSMAVAVPGRAQEFERAVGSVTDISPPSSLWSDCLLSATEKIASLARSRPSVRDPPRSRPSVLEIQVEKLLGDRVPFDF